MNIEYIVIHCSATNPNQDIGAAEIDQWHRAKGWSGIGYHFVICRDGKIELGKPLHRIGAHAYGYNRVSWGLCMVGGVDSKNKPEDNFTNEQYTSLRNLLNVLSNIEPKAGILGHRDLSPDINGDGVIEKWEWMKDCPCFDVREFIKKEDSCKKKSLWNW